MIQKQKELQDTHDLRHVLGRLGEDLAAAFLQAQGYEIVRRNYRCPYGEIDLIVRKETTISFVEVKTRTGDGYGSPGEAVGRRKREKMKVTARYFLMDDKDYEETLWTVEFQVIEICVNQMTGLVF